MSTFKSKGTPDLRRALFGGAGTVGVWNLLGARQAPPFSAVLGCELEVGGRVGRHQQSEFPEIIVGIRGTGRARVSHVDTPLCAGDVVYLALGAILEIENLGDQPLEYLIIKAAT